MKKKVLISSILTIAMCLSIIAGSTFAIFTSESKVDVSVTAANVKVSATVLDETLATYSMGVLQAEHGSFENGGSAVFDSVTSTLTLNDVTPGDMANFKIQVTNSSDVTIQYRVKWSIGGKLAEVLTATVDGEKLVNGTSEWAKWLTSEESTKTIDVSVLLPLEIGNTYQNESASINFTVEAVQGNAVISEVSTVEQLRVALSVGMDNVSLIGDINVPAGEKIEIPEDSELTLNLLGHKITGGISYVNGSSGAVIVNRGTLTINGDVNSVVSANAVANGRSAVDNYGTLTLNGGKYIGSDLASGGQPLYTITNRGGTLTINDGTIVEGAKGIAINAGNAIINGGEFTSTYTENATVHTVYVYGSSNLVINGGTFKHMMLSQYANSTGASVIVDATTGSVTINDGNFTGGCFSIYDYGFGGPKTTVYGGTFDRLNLGTGYVIPADYCAISDNGDGTWTVVPKAGVTLVKNAADLAALSAKSMTSNNGVVEEATIVLTADIDMADADFSAVVAQYNDNLTFVGNGHTISNVNVISGENDNSTKQASMFYGYSGSTLTISDLTLSGIKATTEMDSDAGNYAAAVVGYCEGNLILNNVDVIGAQIIGAKSSGVLAGHISGSLTATDCDVTNSSVTIQETTFEAEGHYAGKAFGTLEGSKTATLNNCTFDATVGGNLKASNAGNLYGRNLGTLIVNGVTAIADGIGTDANGNYCISNANGLVYMQQTVSATASGTVNDGAWVLMNDIDMSGVEWTPICNFHGTFDGNGHTISNLTVNTDGTAGLFGTNSNNGDGFIVPTVKNFNMTNASVTGASMVGVVVGGISAINIDSVNVTASSATGAEFVAGIIGWSYGPAGANVTNCTVSGCTISNTDGSTGGKVGGIGGYIALGTVTGCSVTDTTIDGYKCVGEILGRAGNAGDSLLAKVYDNTASGNTVTGATDEKIGGLIGDKLNVQENA